MLTTLGPLPSIDGHVTHATVVVPLLRDWREQVDAQAPAGSGRGPAGASRLLPAPARGRRPQDILARPSRATTCDTYATWAVTSTPRAEGGVALFFDVPIPLIVRIHPQFATQVSHIRR